MKKEAWKKPEWIAVLFASILIPILFLVIFGLRYGFAFEQNDDRFISQLLSGAITGKSTFHTVYNNFWVSFPLSILYRIAAKVPWWGLFVLFVNALSMGSILYFTLGKCISGDNRKAGPKNGKKTKINLTGILLPAGVFLGVMLLIFSEYRIVGSLQYTSVAIFAAMAGYICLVLGDAKIPSLVLFFLLELLAFFMRDKSMELIQPMGMLLFAGVLLGKRGEKETKDDPERIRLKYLTLGSFLCASLLVIVILGLFGKIFSGEYKKEWRQFDSFNQMRTQFYDYNGIPAYDEVKGILDAYGVTETDWEAFSDYSIASWPQNKEMDKALISYAKAHQEKRYLGEMLKDFFTQSVTRGEARPILLLWSIALLAVFLLRKFRYFWPLGGIMLARTASWGYLVYGGRIMDRVSVPLLLAEGLGLLTVLVLMLCPHFKKSGKKTKVTLIKNIVLGVGCLCFAAVSLYTGRNQLRTAHTEYETQKILSESFLQVVDYCNARPEESFILDINSFTSVHGPALEKSLTTEVNYRMSGGWFAAEPVFKASFGDYLKKNPNFCYIVFDFGSEWSRIGLGTANYYREITGSEPELIDEIPVSSGGTYLVYRFKSPEQ